MATTTPKLGLQKPVADVETDWGLRLNETADILDDAVLTANLSGAGTVRIIDDGSGNVTVTGSSDDSDIDSINTVTGTLTLQGVEGVTIVDDTTDSNTPILTVSGFLTEFVNASGSLQTQIDTKSHSTLTDLSNDDHSQYALLAGRAGGQSLLGGTGAGDNLTLVPSSDSSPGKLLVDGQVTIVPDLIEFADPVQLLNIMPKVDNINIANPIITALDLSPSLVYTAALSKGFNFLTPLSFKPSLTSSGLGAGSDLVNYAAAFLQPRFDGAVGPRIANQMFGMFLQPLVLGGDVTTLEGLRVGLNNAGASSTITTGKAISIADAFNLGTITTNICIDIADQTGGAGETISLRSTGTTSTMRHEGAVKIGATTAPTRELDVAGTIVATSGIFTDAQADTYRDAAGNAGINSNIQFFASATISGGVDRRHDVTISGGIVTDWLVTDLS